MDFCILSEQVAYILVTIFLPMFRREDTPEHQKNVFYPRHSSSLKVLQAWLPARIGTGGRLRHSMFMYCYGRYVSQNSCHSC